MGKGFSHSTSDFPLSIIQRELHFRLRLHVIITKTNGRSLGTFQTAMLFCESENIGQISTATLFFLLQSVHFRSYIIAHNNYVWKGGCWRLPSLLDLSYSIVVRNVDTFRNSLYLANFRDQFSTGHSCRWKQCSSCPKYIFFYLRLLVTTRVSSTRYTTGYLQRFYK
jgi:hypothetical protein